jgi:hypothetical protein
MDDATFDKLTRGDEYQTFFALMESLGYKKVHVNYSGGGDSGGTDSIDFYPVPKDNDKNKKEKYDIQRRISERFEEFLSNPIYSRHGSFADGGGYSVDGVVVWDIPNKAVTIEGTEHNWGYNDGEEDEEEEVCEDTGFEEPVYSFDEGSPDHDRSFEVLCFYVRNILKGKLPEVLHNRVLAAIIEGDESAKDYVAFLEEKKEKV